MTIEATGAGEQSHVVFTSILGVFSSLYEASGDDGELTIEENSNTNVTNFTTARYALVVQANYGSLPSNRVSLLLAERSVSASRLLRYATFIRLIVDNPAYQLPPGHDSILEFIQDEEAVEEFGTQVDEADYNQAIIELLEDNQLVPGFRDDTIAPRYYQIASSRPGLLSREGEALELNADQTGTIMTTRIGVPVNIPMTWHIDQGVLKVSFDEPIEFTSFVSLSDSNATQEQKDLLSANGKTQLETVGTQTRRDYVLVSTGDLVSHVVTSTLTHYQYPAVTLPNNQVVQVAPGEQVLVNSVELRPSDRIQSLPFTTAELTTDWALDFYYLPDQSAPGTERLLAGEIVTFNPNGTATGRFSNLVVNWSLNEGDLIISYGDSWVQRYKRLDQLLPAHGLFTEITNTVTGERFASYNFAVAVDPSLSVDTGFLVTDSGEFWNSWLNSWDPQNWTGDQLNLDQHFGWTFAENGNSSVISVFQQNQQTGLLRREMEWFMHPGGQFGATGPYQWYCYTPLTECHERRWHPVAVGANGWLYMMEEAWSLYSTTGPRYRHFHPRLNIWGLWPIPQTDLEEVLEWSPSP